MENSVKMQKAAAIICYVAVAFALIVLIICPIVSIFARSIITDGKLDWSNLVQLFSDSEYFQTIGNSLLLGLSVTVLTTIVALPLAYIFSRTSFTKAKWIDIVFMIPFMTPPYISAMGWTKFLGRNGFLQQMLPFIENSQDFLYSFWGLTLIMTFNAFPFMFTLMKNAMLNIPSSLDEAGAVCGGGFFYRLRRIFAPMLLGNYAIAAILVFIRTIGEYGTPAVIGLQMSPAFYVFATSIQRFTTVAPVNFGMSAMLSVVLTILCFALWLVQNYLTEKKTYKVVSGKGVRVSYKKMPLWGKIICIAYIAIILLLAVGVPYFSVVATSLFRTVSGGLSADNLTFDNYIELFESGGRGVNAILISLFLAVTSGTIASVPGTIICTFLPRKNRLSTSCSSGTKPNSCETPLKKGGATKGRPPPFPSGTAGRFPGEELRQIFFIDRLIRPRTRSIPVTRTVTCWCSLTA